MQHVQAKSLISGGANITTAPAADFICCSCNKQYLLGCPPDYCLFAQACCARHNYPPWTNLKQAVHSLSHCKEGREVKECTIESIIKIHLGICISHFTRVNHTRKEQMTLVFWQHLVATSNVRARVSSKSHPPWQRRCNLGILWPR